VIALDGCRIERAVDGRVEIVAADARNRAFPDRVTESLGVCLKFGPDHEVRADGKKLRYPRDAICVRPPGCVWSTAATGPVGFLSIDIESALLPPGGLRGSMSFAERADLPDLSSVVSTLVRSAPGLWKEWLVTHLVDALLARGLVRAPDLDSGRVPRAAARAREILEQTIAEPPSLTELATAVGANPFVLLREFRRYFGLPPHAFLLRLRADRARALLARGGDLAEVAQCLGFADQSHLTRVFKRLYGITPAAYRRASRC
jgi:AraC-like DNA-binding protein